MNVIKTSDFKKAFDNLQKNIQRLYSTQEKRFLFNPRDPRLHIKKLKEFDEAFSFRITRKYRTLFYFQNSMTAVFFDIDHRKNVYRQLF